jgi:hypothetical protein
VEFELEGPDRTRIVDLSDAVRTADYTRMFSEFADAIRMGKVLTLDISRGLHIQRVVEAADTELVLHR